MSVVAAGIIAAGSIGSAAIASNNKSSPPTATATGGDILQGQINAAPQILSLSQTQDPQYQALQNQLMQQSLFGNAQTPGLIDMYGQAAPQLQQLQTGLNTQQAQGNIGIVNDLASSAMQAYQSANPQLQQLQSQLTGLAMNNQNPVSQINGAGSWGQGFNNQIGQTLQSNQVQGTGVGYQNVGAGFNPTVNMLNQTAQQQLALGGSVSQQQAAALSNQVLSNYNQMGRANDPTAIAGLATGLDTYSQQLLQQREQNASNAGSLAAQQQGLGLTAQQSNQGANLSAGLANQATGLAAQQSNQTAAMQGLGLQYQGYYGSGAQQLQGQQANQAAQLQNAQYQSGLLTTAANLAQSTAVNPYSLILGQSGALGNAMGSASAAGANNGQSLASMYNPFNTQLINTLTNSGTQTSLANQSNTANAMGGAMSSLGTAGGALGGNWGALLGAMCWVARTCYGVENPKWMQFRHYLLTKAPDSLRQLYIDYGEGIAERLAELPFTRIRIRQLLDQILTEEGYA